MESPSERLYRRASTSQVVGPNLHGLAALEALLSGVRLLDAEAALDGPFDALRGVVRVSALKASSPIRRKSRAQTLDSIEKYIGSIEGNVAKLEARSVVYKRLEKAATQVGIHWAAWVLSDGFPSRQTVQRGRFQNAMKNLILTLDPVKFGSGGARR